MASQLQKYSHSQIKKMAARDELSEGWYAFLVTDMKRLEEDGKPIKFRCNCAPLTDPEDVGSKHRVSMNMDLVLAESETSGEVLPFQLTQAADVGNVLFIGEERPIWNKAARKWIHEGNELNSEEGNEKLADIREAGLNALIEAYNDESGEQLGAIVGQKAFYGRVKRSSSKNPEYAGRMFANITDVRAALPEDAVLVDVADFILREKEDEAEKPVAKKPAPKKAGKR